MQTLEAIFTRRSIRDFRPDAVPAPVLREILKAAMAAPSAMDEQPWHFVVLAGDSARAALDEMQPKSPMAGTAPAAILVCCDMNLVKLPDFWIQDCAASTQNILLAAHDLGLGAVWVGIHPMPARIDALRKRLNLPVHIAPFSMVALGFPGESLGPRDTFQNERIHDQKWSP